MVVGSSNRNSAEGPFAVRRLCRVNREGLWILLHCKRRQALRGVLHRFVLLPLTQCDLASGEIVSA